MTATDRNGQYQGEEQVDSVYPNTNQGQDQDRTVRPNGVHPEEPVLAQAAQTSPDELSNSPALHSPSPTPGVAYDQEHRPSSPQSSFTHTEITGGITDRSNRRRSIMDVRPVLLNNLCSQ